MLNAAIALDGMLFSGFGIATLVAPIAVFGTIADLTGAEYGTLARALMSSLSIFYILIGLLCFVAVSSSLKSRRHFGLAMSIGHICTAWKGYSEIGQNWLIGDPWPDIVIHISFVVAYLILFYFTRTGRVSE